MNNTGGPAFPRNILDHGHGVKTTHESGMTLRDYFAAKAMHAERMDVMEGVHLDYFETTARRAYMMADAMLKARAA